MALTLTLQSNTPITHDTYHLVFDKPDGFTFEPGQATAMTLHRDGWAEEDRPFTFTSQPEDPTLDFVIKTYPADDPDHDGMTAQVATLKPGETVSIEDEAFGAIEDRGPGVFIAGGAGITPFIPILRRRHRDGTLDGSVLIYSNAKAADIILREEWEGMDGLHTVFTTTDETGGALSHAVIDDAFLADLLPDFDRRFYICGPEEMVEDIGKALQARNIPDANIIQDQW